MPAEDLRHEAAMLCVPAGLFGVGFAMLFEKDEA